MIQECDTRSNPSCSGNTADFDGINLIYAGGHCHAPSCISMELFNADTGKLLCKHDPVYGQSDKVRLYFCLVFWFIKIIIIILYIYNIYIYIYHS